MTLTPPYGGCLWDIDVSCIADEWDVFTPEQQERALALASTSLRRLTAYRVGGCPLTVRPCTQNGCWGYYTSGYGGFQPNNWNGRWTNSCGCQGSCGSGCEVTLPSPVGRVDQVKVDGAVLDPADYQIQNSNILVWIGDDPCPFPQTQDLGKADTEPGTFSVTFLNAYPVDNLGATAAAFLALEFAKACRPKGKCNLPRGVTNVVRNGISFEIEAGLFPNGLTGIDIVDGFIDAWNPDHRTQQTRIYSPS